MIDDPDLHAARGPECAGGGDIRSRGKAHPEGSRGSVIDGQRRRRVRAWPLWLGFALASGGCGGEEAEPNPQIRVLLVDRETGESVQGASIAVGSKVYRTDAEGQAEVPAGSALVISQTGYKHLTISQEETSATSLTLPLSPSSVRQRTVRGLVGGWGALPELEAGKYRLVRIEGSRRKDTARIHEALASRLIQGGAAAQCLVRGAASPCAYELNVGVDARFVFASVVEGDDAGTPEDFTDDVVTPAGFGIVEIAPGESLLSDQTVTLLSAADTAVVSVVPGTGSGSVAAEPVGVPGLSLGEQVLIFPSFDGELTGYSVPLQGAAGLDLEAGALWGVGAASDEAGSGLVVKRGAELPTAAGELRSLELPGLPSLPELTSAAAEVRLELAPGSVGYVTRDGAEFLGAHAIAFEPPVVSAWIQVCAAPAGEDLAQALSLTESCAGRVVLPD